ncbi:MAG: hypothetical protein J5496_04170 [Lachnospiraceae bacterium]|nr:hypothetical protein [Lachnospiraceae bacterium]
MLGLSVIRLKDFTRHLFVSDSFDDFYLSEARFATSFTASFDGKILSENAPSPYISWGRLRPLAYQLIKGKELPKSFSLVLVYPEEKTAALLAAAGREADPENLPSLFLNLRYRQEQLMLTTGISEQSFFPDFELPKLWDRQVLQILSERGLQDAVR